jgi:hypothetical protein
MFIKAVGKEVWRKLNTVCMCFSASLKKQINEQTKMRKMEKHLERSKINLHVLVSNQWRGPIVLTP